jgi:hypothetical protein
LNVLFKETNTKALLTAKEETDMEVAARLRKTGVIKTPGFSFEASDKQEIDSLIKAGVLDICKFNSTLHGTTRIFNSRMVREVKAKTTDSSYKNSRLVIRAYNDEEKNGILNSITNGPTSEPETDSCACPATRT